MLSKSQVKYIQSLGQKKRRDEEGLFIAEGPKLVTELLKEQKVAIKEIYALKEWIQSNRQVIGSFPIIEIDEADLERISQLTTPHAVLAIAEKINWDKNYVLKGNVSLALYAIRDPGNFGTIIRIADWFGINQIFSSSACADLYNPKVVQATMGSIARVRVETVELETWLRENKEIRTYAAVLEGRDISRMEKLTEGIIVIGNESKGISDEILNVINVKITIPKKGKAESLNAAVASGIILSHLIL